ncbi:MAG: hypothetical protein ACR2GZ_02045 [Solirubrobacteraceae bacterium]
MPGITREEADRAIRASLTTLGRITRGEADDIAALLCEGLPALYARLDTR